MCALLAWSFWGIFSSLGFFHDEKNCQVLFRSRWKTRDSYFAGGKCRRANNTQSNAHICQENTQLDPQVFPSFLIWCFPHFCVVDVAEEGARGGGRPRRSSARRSCWRRRTPSPRRPTRRTGPSPQETLLGTPGGAPRPRESPLPEGRGALRTLLVLGQGGSGPLAWGAPTAQAASNKPATVPRFRREG